MGTCIIFCAAEFDVLVTPIGPEDFVIAADGGLQHAKKLGITPDVILGDFDSLGYTPGGASVFPVEKDDTDSMLAVRRGLDWGYREFLLYGSLDGPGWTIPWPIFRPCNFCATMKLGVPSAATMPWYPW